MLSSWLCLLLLCTLTCKAVLTPAQWRGQSIYHLLTDRFALAGRGSAGCDFTKYCGGSFKGIEERLDYIQGMGFTAVSNALSRLERDEDFV